MISLLLPLAALAAPPETRHAIEVLTRSEYGPRRSHTVRWSRSPSMAIIGGSPEHQALAWQTAEVLSALIAPLAITPADDPQAADIRLYFTPQSQMPAIAAAEGFPYTSHNAGFFWLTWERAVLTSAVVMVMDTRPADADITRHLVLEELTQSLGLVNDSAVFSDSVFYAESGEPGLATRLSANDEALVTLLYGLRPGARRCAVRRAVAKKSTDPAP